MSRRGRLYVFSAVWFALALYCFVFTLNESGHIIYGLATWFGGVFSVLIYQAVQYERRKGKL